MKRINDVMMRDVRILFRNFSGKGGQYNPEGQRNFCALLPDDLADKMKVDGWNVKYLEPRDESEAPQPYIQVKVRYDNFPPKIVLVTSKGKSILNEETVSNLDLAEIERVDLVISPYSWTMPNGKSGVTAYVKSMYVTIAEDPLEALYYSDTAPDSASDAIGGCGHCVECDGSCGNACAF